jgi:hypothetical protein
MFSLKHVEDDGRESIMGAVSVSFDPKGTELTGYGSPGPDEGARKNGVVRYASGLVYVMNEQGKTVGVYSLRTK